MKNLLLILLAVLLIPFFLSACKGRNSAEKPAAADSLVHFKSDDPVQDPNGSAITTKEKLPGSRKRMILPSRCCQIIPNR